MCSSDLPEVLSHGAASILEDVDRPACLWTIDLDARGEVVSARVERALVRSRARLTYAQIQAAINGEGSLPPSAPDDLPGLLAEIGRLRLEREAARGGISMTTPEQVIKMTEAAEPAGESESAEAPGPGGYRLAAKIGRASCRERV